MVSRVKDLSGLKFERLLVLRLDRIDEKQNARWICRCDCGSEVSIRGFNLTGGKSRSCGCFQKSRVSQRVTTHGKSKRPEYRVWSAMIKRCRNTKDPSYVNYGGRGITVCDEWAKSFESFITDMGDRPSNLHSIDRIKNDEGYSKANCRWATRAEQNRNHRRNRWIETPLGRMLLCEAAEKSGIGMVTLRSRLRRGWPPERLFDPIQASNFWIGA